MPGKGKRLFDIDRAVSIVETGVMVARLALCTIAKMADVGIGPDVRNASETAPLASARSQARP